MTFDFDFQLRYLKPFSVFNYAQKLINELENSNYDKTDTNLEIIFQELALHANHYSTTYIMIVGVLQLIIILIQG